MASLVLATLGLAQVHPAWAQLQAPPPGTDLAPATVAPTRQPAMDGPTSKPAALAAKSRPQQQVGTRFSGTLTAIDRVAMTISVESKGKSRSYHVTPRTRFFKDRKPAVVGDGAIGEPVSGLYKTAKDGKAELISATFGGKKPPTSGGNPAKK